MPPALPITAAPENRGNDSHILCFYLVDPSRFARNAAMHIVTKVAVFHWGCVSVWQALRWEDILKVAKSFNAKIDEDQ